MTDVEKLAQKVRNFKYAISGGGILQGGFGELPPVGQGDITLDQLEKAFSEFRLQGSQGIQAWGSMKQGYVLMGDGTGGGGGGTP